MNRSSALLGLTAAVAAPRFPLSAQGLTKVRTFALAVDQAGPLYFAKELGYFQKAGLDVDISNPTDYGAVVSAVVGGSGRYRLRHHRRVGTGICRRPSDYDRCRRGPQRSATPG